MKFQLLKFRFISLLKYYLRASTRYDIQSPLVHNLLSAISLKLNNNERAICDNIESIRSEYLKREQIVGSQDYGAGTTLKNGRLINVMAQSVSSDASESIILARIAKYFDARKIVELGTNLGIATAYLARINNEAKVSSIEGNIDLVQLSRETVSQAEAQNVQIHHAEFSKYLQNISDTYDFVYMDGHHDGDATVGYFNALRSSQLSQQIFVLDDIRWSQDMYSGWQHIIDTCEPIISIDFGTYGVVIFSERIKIKQNFRIIPYWFKPWRLGLFPRMPKSS